MTSKIEIAKKIFEANQGIARKDMIAKFMSEANLTQAGASTYFANFKKIADMTKVLTSETPMSPSEQEAAHEAARERQEESEVAEEQTKNEKVVEQVFAKADSKPKAVRGPGGRFIKQTA
jgi:hypothetical protein